MEWRMEKIDQQLICKLYLHLIIKNNDTVNALSLPAIPLTLDYSSLINKGTEIGT